MDFYLQLVYIVNYVNFAIKFINILIVILSMTVFLFIFTQKQTIVT